MPRGGNNRIDLTGQRFGRLTVSSYARTVGKVAYWICRCDCGNDKSIAGHSLRGGYTLSCGCLRNETTSQRNMKHGMTRHPMYKTWADMIHRCTNDKNEFYADYGGRGIKVYEEWTGSPENFLKWCDEQSPPPGYTLDRRDVNGDYHPDNCHFVSPHDQNRNMRSNVWVEINGERLILKDAVAKYGKCSYDVAKYRVRVRKWDPVLAITTPSSRRK